jgi:hypothetical protein
MTMSYFLGTLPEIQHCSSKLTWLVSRKNIITQSPWKLPVFIINDIQPRYVSVSSPVPNLIHVRYVSFYRRNMRSDIQTREHDTRQGNVAVMVEPRTWATLGSNLGQTTSNSDWCFCGFSQIHKANAGTVPWLRYNRLPHQSVIYHWPYHSTIKYVWSPRYLQRGKKKKKQTPREHDAFTSCNSCKRRQMKLGNKLQVFNTVSR